MAMMRVSEVVNATHWISVTHFDSYGSREPTILFKQPFALL